ncbi:HI1506-related protein [Erwinia tracheiphila]|uniref:HI1506-related protein n=1 Tax=Erwinia tracheiphila TaxID=65700 RepID=UPI001F3E8124|nr:HI1506-related protein [Erwinia tracheiphila]UIA93057.1 HI1506-related protein [Erwinia tracheiphila]
MPNQNANMEYVDMVGISVVNTAHDGLSAGAGFVFARGWTYILPPVTAQQWQTLAGDPRLSGHGFFGTLTDDFAVAGAGQYPVI